MIIHSSCNCFVAHWGHMRREERDQGSLLATWSTSLAKDGKLNRRNLNLPSTPSPPFALSSDGRIDD